MLFTLRSAFLVFILSALFSPVSAGAAPKTSGADHLKQLVADLQKNPGNRSLREKIILTAAGMKPSPTVPESAVRNMARGTAFAQKASDDAGYRKAIEEFEAATNAAPWLALAYYNLGVVQERAGQFKQAIQSLNFYLVASPKAKNVRDVKNKIYALEAEVEIMQEGSNASGPGAEPETAGKQLGVAGGQELEIESDKELRIIKLTQEKKAKMPDFTGNWFYKEPIRGEERTYHAFEITKNGNGDLALNPPQRTTDSIATVIQFVIDERNLKVQIKWRSKSQVGYWKTETFEVKLSDDGKKLVGAHRLSAVNNYRREMDRVLFRQKL